MVFLCTPNYKRNGFTYRCTKFETFKHGLIFFKTIGDFFGLGEKSTTLMRMLGGHMLSLQSEFFFLLTFIY